jgi:hypothetical protein
LLKAPAPEPRSSVRARVPKNEDESEYQTSKAGIWSLGGKGGGDGGGGGGGDGGGTDEPSWPCRRRRSNDPLDSTPVLGQAQ